MSSTPDPVLPPRRVLGVQPVLLVGIALLAIVSAVTVVLILTGDVGAHASRVVWTVVVFLGFTGLLALDLVLARRDATPLVLGVAANTYLLAVLMIGIWVRPSAAEAGGAGLAALLTELLGLVLLTALVARAAAAGAWGLLVLGRRTRAAVARAVGVVGASLVGAVGVLLTLHTALDAFGIPVGEAYWRATVAAIVVAALAASTAVLLFWNRRNLDWQEAEARGEHRTRPAAARPALAPALQAPQRPQGLLPWPLHPDGTPLPVGPDGQPVFSAR